MADKIDTARLRALAEKASAGPWGFEEHTSAVVIADSEGYSAGGSAKAIAERVYLTEDREYIAALDPQTFLAMLDELDGRRANREYAIMPAESCAGEPRMWGTGEASMREVYEQERVEEPDITFVSRVKAGPWEVVPEPRPTPNMISRRRVDEFTRLEAANMRRMAARMNQRTDRRA